VVERTLDSSAPVSNFLQGALERFDERDQGLLRELTLGTLRWLRRLDDVLVKASNRKLEEIEPCLLSPLRVGAYQLLLLDRIPSYAAVDEAVEQARYLTHRGGASFVNAVMRRIGRSPRFDDWPVDEADKARRLGIEWSHPDFLVKGWSQQFGWERTLEMMAANNRPKPMHLAAFRDRGGREALAESLIDQGLEVEPSPLSPLGLIVRRGDPLATDSFRRGDAYIQDEASQLAALIPPPEPGEFIFDAAASPGGKSFAMIGWEPSVRLVTGDLDLHRMFTLRENLTRLRRTIPILTSDAGQPGLRAGFDRVVLDLPCSGTGTLRKHPELKWRLSPGELGRLARQALRVLRGSAPLVRPGGLLVAITCSVDPADNEAVIDEFLAIDKGFEPLPLEGRLAQPMSNSIEAPGRWRLLPGGDHDGFTVHVLRRRSSS
jgi:16S rRNA (cytosine967-C5)-methyltransferase